MKYLLAAFFIWLVANNCRCGHEYTVTDYTRDAEGVHINIPPPERECCNDCWRHEGNARVLCGVQCSPCDAGYDGGYYRGYNDASTSSTSTVARDAQ